jgi:nucleotide-binding universal stress UspA family protein
VVDPILLCTDGSDLALGALSAGLDLIRREGRLVLVTVSDGPDPGSLVGSGHAGAELTPEEYDQRVVEAAGNARATVDEARRELGIAEAETRVLEGDPGRAICRLASDLSAGAIVIGSRGRGGIRRAFLGSVSDHVVRNAPCSVIVTRSQA